VSQRGRKILLFVQELKEQELMEEQRRRQMEEENYRLEREAEERERQRRLEEHRDIQKKVAKERIEQLKSTTLGARALATYSEEVRLLFFMCTCVIFFILRHLTDQGHS